MDNQKFLKVDIESFKSWKKSGVLFFKIQCFSNSCPDCKKQNGKIISVNDIKISKNAPPFKFCKNEWCKCSLQPQEVPLK